MKNVLIIGAGWLGLSLAKTLNKGFDVTCFYRSECSKDNIQSYDIKTISFEENWSNFDIAIMCFPPGKLKSEYSESVQNYLSKLSNNTKIILTSSTGVYPNESLEYTEDTEFIAPHNKLHLKEAEDIILKRNDSAVLRLGGLIGPNRHPIKFLSGKPIKNPDGPINLIHQEDVIRAIEMVIKQNFSGVLNVTCPSNLTRFQYYCQMAKTHGLTAPIYASEHKINRKISTTKITQILNFTFNQKIDNF